MEKKPFDLCIAYEKGRGLADCNGVKLSHFSLKVGSSTLSGFLEP